jgi:SagB-type dehydrogenase family enzyme
VTVERENVSTFLLSWGEGVTVATAEAGDFVVQGPPGRISLRHVSPHVVNAFRQIEPTGTEDQRLVEVINDNGDEILARWYYYLDRLTRRGLLCHSAHENGVRLATLVAISPSFAAKPGRVVTNQQYILSRFACLRRDGNDFVLESSLAHARIVMNDCRTAALVAAVSVPASPAVLAEHPHGLNRESIDSVLSLMLRAGILCSVSKDGISCEDQNDSLQTWSFHDLFFHSRAREGRSAVPHGGTYRFLGRIPPPQAIKPPMGTEFFELDRPDLQQLERDDPPLARVHEQRRSIREFDAERPVTAQQIGEFLFRVARTKDYQQSLVPNETDPVQMDFASRPYPSGGGLYEIEFYLVIQKCRGIDPGLYHYATDRHVLERLPAESEHTTDLLRDAAESTSTPLEEVQILVILAARVPRLAWKYESIAYSLVLKHVGVIFQSMYLAATAMGLAPCAVGGGDSDLFARATGLDYSTESSVGEFLLGSTRPEFADRVRLRPEGEI